MHLQVLQPGGAVFYLIPDGEFFLCPKLREHILLLCHGPETLLIPGNDISGNIAFHSRLIAILKMDGPLHAGLFAVPVNLTLARVKIHLVNTKVIHTEGVENVITPLLKLSKQVPPF